MTERKKTTQAARKRVRGPAQAPAPNRSQATFAGPDRTAPVKTREAPSDAQRELIARKARTKRSIYFTLGSNIAVGVAKGVGAFVTGSGALLAESLHSVADTGNAILLLWGRREAKTPASPDHPLGHGRATYFWSFIVASLLFSAGGVVSIYEGIHKLETGTGIESPWVAISILLFALGAEGTSQFVTLKSISRRRGKASLWRWLRDTRHSELIVVFAEDAAALLGVVIALAAVVATQVTGNEVYDAVASIVIGALLLVVAIALCIEIKSLLIGESAAPTVRNAIVDFLESREHVVKVAHLISSQHGDSLMLGIKAEMDGKLSARELVAAINTCEDELRAAFPQVVWIFFEPVAAANEDVK